MERFRIRQGPWMEPKAKLGSDRSCRRAKRPTTATNDRVSTNEAGARLFHSPHCKGSSSSEDCWSWGGSGQTMRYRIKHQERRINNKRGWSRSLVRRPLRCEHGRVMGKGGEDGNEERGQRRGARGEAAPSIKGELIN